MTEQTTPATEPDAVARKRSVWKPLAAAGIGGAVLVATGFGVFAQLNATAYNTTPQVADTGDLKLTMAPDAAAGAGGTSAGFTSSISNLAPLDTVNRLVTLKSPGSLDGQLLTLKVVDTVGSLLSTDATRGLQVTVQNCTAAWTTTVSSTPNASLPTCGAGATTALAKTPLSGLGTATPLTASVLAGAVNHLLVTVGLPDQTETSTNGGVAVPVVGTGTIQKLNASLTWTFSDVQRTAVNINS